MSPLEMFGWAGSIVIVGSLLQTRILWLRVLNSIGCVMLVIYNAILQLWPMVTLNVVLVGINVYFLLKLRRARNDAREYQVSPIGVDEPFLAQALARHEADIRTFSPGLGPNLVESAERAFLVTTGDELVSIMLSRPGDRPGEEQLIVDYALPRFRDFTPGQFVYSPQGPFATLGCTAIAAPPGMKGATKYHKAVGFAPEGDKMVRRLA